MDWILIYNDGTNISVVKSQDVNWNNAPQNNVQFKIIIKCNGHRKITTGRDEYFIKEPNSNKKFGSFISDAEYRRTRHFLIYGDY